MPWYAETGAGAAGSEEGYIIVYKCDKCGAVVRNKAAYPAKVQPDDIDLLIKLTVARD